MGVLENMNCGDNILYSSGYFSGDYSQDLYIKRSHDDGSNRPKYYLNIVTTIDGELVQQGYLYFYLDFEHKMSDFIGVKVNEKYRDLNIGSFLVANWIDLCLNNGYDFLGANKKQRKPFLLYLLKTYGFEIFDVSLYDSRDDVITICRSVDYKDKRKILLFKDPKHEKVFVGTNCYKDDNYEIVHDKKGIITLDNVILPLQNMSKDEIKYELMNLALAEEKTMKVIKKHKK